MGSPLVSFVIPLYNYKKYIGYCIQSILNQDYDNLEIIVVDDFSTDSSVEKAKKFKDPRIQIVELPKNQGYSVAKNTGIIKSNGELICILDADDMLMPMSISSRVRAMEEFKSMFVYANAIAVYDSISIESCYEINPKKLGLWTKKTHKKKKITLLRFPSPYNIHAQTVMVRREVYETFGLYDEKLKSRSDREMWWRFFGKESGEKENISRYFLDYPVVYYRYHDKSMMRKRAKDKKYDRKVRQLCEHRYQVRKDDGITTENTKFLENRY